MEGKKYYTPEINEFHVGFEYEYKDGPESDFEPKIHTVFTEQEKRMWVHEFRELEGKYVAAPIFYRVKYLDREDIESVLDLKVFSFIFKDNILELRVKGEIKYKGICKNKSELKRIVESIR